MTSRAFSATLPALRPPSRIQQRLIRSAVEIEADDPDAILFQHTVFCQTGLPYRNPGEAVRIWERYQGTATPRGRGRSRLSPGRTDAFVDVGLPFGPKPRLILVYLNAEALRTGSPVDRGRGQSHGLRQRHRAVSETGATCAPSKTSSPGSPPPRSGLPWPTARRRPGRSTRTSSAASISGSRRTSGSGFSGPPPSLFTLDYFESLQRHAVPLDERADCRPVPQRHGARLYCWLAQRLHRVSPGSPPSSRGRRSEDQFGWHYGRMDKFKRVFRADPRHGAEPVPGRPGSSWTTGA